MATNLQQLFRHNAWANRRLLEACRALDADQLAATCVGTYGPTVMAEAVPVMVAESMFGARSEPVPAVEAGLELASAEAPNALRRQREGKLQRFRESLATPLADPVPPRAANAGLFQRIGRL